MKLDAKVAPWRGALLAKMATLVILAIVAKIARGLAITVKNVRAPKRLAILAKIATGVAISRTWQIECQK